MSHVGRARLTVLVPAHAELASSPDLVWALRRTLQRQVCAPVGPVSVRLSQVAGAGRPLWLLSAAARYSCTCDADPGVAGP